MFYTYTNNSDKELIRKIGLKIKMIRLEANMSQTSLSKKTGMSRSSIAAIENGRNFNMESLIAIARTLGFLDKLEFFFKEEILELSPMQIYELEKSKRKKGGYNK